MGQAPTWAQLRIDVTNLIQEQKECYRSVHDMLDRAIPEIDRKLSIYYGSKPIQNYKITKSPSYPNFSRYEKPVRLKQPYTQQSKAQQQKQQQPQQKPTHVHKQHQQQRQSKKVASPTPTQPTILEVPTKIASNQTFKKPQQSQANGYTTKQERNGNTNGYHAPTNRHRETVADGNHYETIDYTKAMTNGHRKEPIDYRKKITTDRNHNHHQDQNQNGAIDYRKKVQTERRKADHDIGEEQIRHYEEIQYPIAIREKPNLDELVHLRPLTKPLSYYLKKNRPDLVMEADRRVMYLKKKAERRRHIAATRTVNALDLIRSSSRSSSHRGTSSVRSLSRTVSRDNMHPNYQVKCRLSEQEMKRLTARTYNRLPEVKKQRNEQVSKHMKVQNYKNKMDYGRKLLENRRQGIINYPLRSYEDSSNMSSQEESFTNSLDQSADALKFEQYY